MRKGLSILFLLFITLCGFTQNDSIRGNQFELEGRIINEVSIPPLCGYFAFATVVELKVLKFSNPEYELDSIGVIFMCPDSYANSFFELGEKYFLTLVDQNPADFGWIIPNESISAKYQLDKNLWVIDVEKIE